MDPVAARARGLAVIRQLQDRVASAAASAAAASAGASAKGAARFSSSGDPTLTRAVYERYVRALPTVDAYVAWAKWEMR